MLPQFGPQARDRHETGLAQTPVGNFPEPSAEVLVMKGLSHFGSNISRAFMAMRLAR
jgi:hypothetical protein